MTEPIYIGCEARELWRYVNEKLPVLASELQRKAPKEPLYVLGSMSLDAMQRAMSSRVDAHSSCHVLFRKGDLILSSVMSSKRAACPACILLFLSTSSEMIDCLSRTEDFEFPDVELDAASVAPLDEFVSGVDIETGELFSARIPPKHPCCQHVIQEASRAVDVFPALQKSSSEQVCQNLLTKFFDPKTGIFRIHESLRDVASAELQPLFDLKDVCLSWFINPAFPFFPSIEPLDLAIGTGESACHAKLTAVFETIERFIALSPPESHPVQAHVSFESLDRCDAIEPERIWSYAEWQLEDENFPFQRIENTSELDWVELNDVHGKRKLVPADFLYINARTPSVYHDNTTSGCAAHVQPELAMLNAGLELVERDCTMRHWVSGSSRPHVSHDSLPSELGAQVAEIATLGFSTSILDLSLYEGVSVYGVYLENQNSTEWPSTIVSSAAHLDPGTAIAKALDEAIGALLISLYIYESSGFRDLSEEEIFLPEDHGAFYRSPKNRGYLHHYAHPESKILFSTGDNGSSSGMESLQRLCKVMDLHGKELLFANLAPNWLQEEGVSVYRCFCPALMPITFGTGMLKLGGCPSDSQHFHCEDLLISIPHPFS